MRRTRKLAARSRSTGLEMLENRRLLSGVVTATLAAGGVLTIKGDGGDNNINVDGSSGSLVITGVGPTFVSFPSSFPAAAISSIKVQLGDGNDAANIHDLTNANGFHLFGNGGLNVTDDKGNDQYTLNNINLAGTSITVATGAGSNSTLIQNTTAAALTATSNGGAGFGGTIQLFTDNLAQTSITTGPSNDTVAMDQSTIFGNLNIATGDGSDTVLIGQLAAGQFQTVTGNFTMDAGKGNDNISVGADSFTSNLQVDGSMNVKANDGFDTVSFEDTTVLNVGGGTSVVDGGNNNDLLHLLNVNGFTTKGFEGFF